VSRAESRLEITLRGLQNKEIQALHAAVSNRSWHGVELAANQIRDKIQTALTEMRVLD